MALVLPEPGETAPRLSHCDVLDNAPEVVFHRLDGINREAIDGGWRSLCAHPLDVVPPDLMPARNAAYSPFYACAVNRPVRADTLNDVQARPELTRDLPPDCELAVADHVVNNSALIEHQLPGNERSQQPEPGGEVVGTVQLGKCRVRRLQATHEPVTSKCRSPNRPRHSLSQGRLTRARQPGEDDHSRLRTDLIHASTLSPEPVQRAIVRCGKSDRLTGARSHPALRVGGASAHSSRPRTAGAAATRRSPLLASRSPAAARPPRYQPRSPGCRFPRAAGTPAGIQPSRWPGARR
jgi:hypothetical protein